MSTILGRAFVGIASGTSVVALWFWGMNVFAPPATARSGGSLAAAPTWQAAAAWSLCAVVIAVSAPLIVLTVCLRSAQRPLTVGSWWVPVGAGLTACLAGVWDLAGVYRGLRAIGIAEHMAGAGWFADAAWWSWLVRYPGVPVRSLVAGFVGVVVVVVWAWRRRQLELFATVAVVAVALSVSMEAGSSTDGGGVLTPLPPDAAGFLWGHVAITMVSGVALTAGVVMSRLVRARFERRTFSLT
ncbi:hypothetical protein [Lentzea sp. CA-135723]|uniref:hypothetical protein n=1 Tax=Lentzea sp. CA-135723 TaxID=3239950 RepID=UPI003D90F1CC